MEKVMKVMTECEKLDAGLAYNFWDKGVNDRKLKAIAETIPVMKRLSKPACAASSDPVAVTLGRHRAFAVTAAATSM